MPFSYFWITVNVFKFLFIKQWVIFKGICGCISLNWMQWIKQFHKIYFILLPSIKEIQLIISDMNSGMTSQETDQYSCTSTQSVTEQGHSLSSTCHSFIPWHSFCPAGLGATKLFSLLASFFCKAFLFHLPSPFLPPLYSSFIHLRNQ